MYRLVLEKRRLHVGVFVLLTSTVLALISVGTTEAAARAPDMFGATVAHVTRAPIVDIGRALPAARINLAIELNYRHEAELDAVIEATSDPRSPEYGDFLSATQFAEPRCFIFGACWFLITRVSPTRGVIDASAPVAVAERFFRTSLHVVRQAATSGTRYANVTPAYLPAPLRGAVYGVAGLDNLIVAKVAS